jgi:hypothetical protein
MGLLAVCLMMQAPPPPGLSAKLPAPPRYRLPPYTLEQEPAGGRMQVGRHRPLPADVVKKGKWYSLPGGRRLWRLQLEAPGAVGLRLHFVRFAAGAGQVWLYSPGDANIAGLYTGRGIGGHGDFWSESTEGASVVVEFAAPAGYKPKLPPFEISEISHLYRPVASLPHPPSPYFRFTSGRGSATNPSRFGIRILGSVLAFNTSFSPIISFKYRM